MAANDSWKNQPRAKAGTEWGGQWVRDASTVLRSYGFDVYESKASGKVVRVEYNGKARDMDIDELTELLQGAESGNVSSDGVNLLSTEPYGSAFSRKQQEIEEAARKAAGLGHLTVDSVRTEQFQFSHTKKPSENQYGMWMFDIDGNQFAVSGTYKDARREALAFANRHGASKIEVLP
jgi:hypothetical protein